MALFDSKTALNHAIRYLTDAAVKRNAGGWVPPKEQERQQRDAMRQEQQQARQAEKQQKEAARAEEKQQKLLSKQYPTHYMPEVGRQVMQDGGMPDPNAPKPLSQIINRNQDIPPSIPDPAPEELAAARADTRVGRDIVAKRLNTIVPESERVVGGKYRPGAPGGGRWSDLPPEVLNSPGRGFNVTDDELQNLWEQSLSESSEAARNAAFTHKVQPKFLANDWDKAMRLPLSDHLWYELSGEKMAENMPDLTHPEFLKLMDLIGATSARAKPGENLERSLAALSQHLRKAPIDVDLTIPETVRQALGRSHEGSSALPGNKTGYFSDTLALTGGVPTRMPISVNDVWVGKMFGVPDNVMSSNQSLHEPMAKYFNKIRDLYNERHGHEVPFPYQSWNFQAPAWVHLRGEEAGEESGDAYHQVWDSIINKLKDKNIPGIVGNQITREALMHPDFADALRRTTAPFRAAPKATVEFGTKLTNVGKTAHEHYQRAVAANDELSQNEYLGGLTKAMYASARGEGHPWERLKKAITGTLGQAGDITRIANPTSENPLDIGGTFEGDVSPNIRVPLKDMSDDQIAYFNAVVGKHLKQKAMAASYVLDTDGPEAAPREGHIRGYSAFVPTTEGMDPADIRAFSKELSKIGHDTSYARYPNGYRFDVIPNYNGDIPKGIDHDQLADAYDATLAGKYGAPAILAHDFKSIYTPDTEYDGLRSKLVKEIQSDFIKQAQETGIPISAARKILAKPSLSSALKGRSAKAWDTYSKRIDHLTASEQGFKDLAQRVSDAHSAFITKAEKRQKKYPEGFARGGEINRDHLAIGGNPGDIAGGGYGTGNIGGGSSPSYSGNGGMDSPSESGPGPGMGGGGGGNGGINIGGGGGGGSSGGGGGGNGGMPGIGLGSVNAFGSPAAQSTFGSTDPGKEADKSMADILAGGVAKSFLPGGDIGTELAKSAVSPDLSGGNSPLASAIFQYDRSALDAQMDRMRAGQQAERDESVARTVGSPPPAEFNIPNAGDLYGATNAPLAVNQQPSGMLGQPPMGATTFGTGIRQLGFPSQQTGPSANQSLEEYMGTVPPADMQQVITKQQQKTNQFNVNVKDFLDATGSPFAYSTTYGMAIPRLEAKNIAFQPGSKIDPATGLPATGVATYQGDMNAKLTPEQQTAKEEFEKQFGKSFTPITKTTYGVEQRGPMIGGDLTGPQMGFGSFAPTSTQPQDQAPDTTSNVMRGTVGITPPSQSTAPRIGMPQLANQPVQAANAQSPMTIRQNFEKAFADARSRGVSTFSWTNPATGKTEIYTTQLARKAGGRVPSLKNPEDWIAQIEKPRSVTKANKPRKPSKVNGAAIVERALMLSSRKS